MQIRKFSVILIILILSFTTAYAADFSDVDANHKNAEAVYKMAEYGIVNGYDDGSFKPDNSVTRAEMCTFIARIFGYSKENKLEGKVPFDDVAEDYWAAEYIKYTYKKGIVNGMGDGTFLPAGNVTYEQAVKMLICTAGLENEAKTYSGEKWYSGYLEAANKNGMLDGVVINVGKGATRADIVQLIYNAVDSGIIIKSDEKESMTDKTDNEEKNNNDVADENVYEKSDELLKDENVKTIIKEIKTIVVDPGHNYEGYDKGARCEDGSAVEEIITWHISEKLADYLEDYGFEVYLTREGEKSSIAPESVVESLRARVDYANNLEADLFISIHCNTGGGTGVETYCFDLNGSSAELAECITDGISEETGMYNRGAKEADFYVIKNTSMPAVLVETGFLDNSEDIKILNKSSGQKKIARAIAEAVYKCKMIEIKVNTDTDDTDEAYNKKDTEKINSKTESFIEETDDEL